jgi:iron complex transport system ATP-binding protein
METKLIQVKNATVFVGGHQALTKVDWEMLADENWAVVGNNGAGKTTFMKLVHGELIPIHGGKVQWFSFPYLAPLWQVREKIGFVSAEYQERYDVNLTGWQVVASGLFASIGLYEKVTQDKREKALEWMDFLGISHLAEVRFRSISYGEARRILLARSLVNNPQLLILDEPCSGLDIPSRESFLETLAKLVTTKTRILYVTHHTDEILPFITHVLYLKDGRVFAQGGKASMLTDKLISGALGCSIQLQENGGRYWTASCQSTAPTLPNKPADKLR